MTHELKKIIQNYVEAQKKGNRCVLATVVALEGSSYRRPGVRMLIDELGNMTGAVSGGCVEKEVLRQSETVFFDGTAKIVTYDGRYRLGCEGILYILVEPFNPDTGSIKAIFQEIKSRRPFKLISYFSLESNNTPMGSVITFENGETIPFSDGFLVEKTASLKHFSQKLTPCFKLMIAGAEHDAVQLCAAASLLGWEVTVIASPKDPKTLLNFPGAEEVLHVFPEDFASGGVDAETAVILMNHNYVTDLKFLIALKDVKPAYIGLLGPAKRREKLLNEFMEYVTEPDDAFLECIYGPAGLNLGAETPQEIAVSILSEILAVLRKQEPFSLKEKRDGIHD